MIVEALDTRNVLIKMGTTDSPFNVIVGPGHACMYRACHIWLLSEAATDTDDHATLLSGIKVACTYPHSLALSPHVRNEAHIFLSYHELFPLPCGWLIEPVPSGTSTTNWLFTHNGGHAVLVCGRSSISPNCLYHPIFRPTRLDLLVHASRGSVAQRSVPDLISLFQSGQTHIQVEDAVSATAVAVHIVHHIAELPIEAHGPVRILLRSPDDVKAFHGVASLYEWLHQAMQVYLRKLARYMCKWNKDNALPLPLTELLNTGRLCFGSIPDAGDKFVVSIGKEGDTFAIMGESSHDELREFLSPITAFNEGSIEYTVEQSLPSCATMSEEVFARTVGLRFPDARWDSEKQTITVPSLAAELKFGCDGKLTGISYSFQDEELKALIHLVS